MPERSKGVDSSSTVFALVGSNPTADIRTPFRVASLATALVLVAGVANVCQCFFALDTPFFAYASHWLHRVVPLAAPQKVSA